MYRSEENVNQFTINELNVTDFTGLSSLKEINEIFDVSFCENLVNFTGLESLEEITYFVVDHNNSLVNFVGLDSVKLINDRFGVQENSSLENFMGLGNLKKIDLPDIGNTGKFSVKHCGNLENFAGLESLDSIKTGFLVEYCNALEDFTGLNSLKYIGGTWSQIGHLDNLESLNGLNNLKHIDEDFSIRSVPISDFEGLENLKEINGKFSIVLLNNIENLLGLSTLTKLEEFVILYCDMILNLQGIEELTEIDSYLSVFSNENLESLNGLGNIEKTGNIILREVPKLSDISALNQLYSLSNNGAHSLWIEDTGLIDLTGLNNIDSISNKVKIIENPYLSSLSGFGNPAFIHVDSLVTISNNLSLTDCAIETVCNRIESNHPIIIEDNAEGCNTVEEVQEQCDAISSTKIYSEREVNIRPNPVASMFRFFYSDYDVDWDLVTVTGQLVQSGQTRIGENRVDVSACVNGVYFLRIGKQYSRTVKLVVQH